MQYNYICTTESTCQVREYTVVHFKELKNMYETSLADISITLFSLLARSDITL